MAHYSNARLEWFHQGDIDLQNSTNSDLLHMYTCKDTPTYKFKCAQSTTAIQAHNFNETSLIGSPLGPKSMVSVMRKEVLVKSEALLVSYQQQHHHLYKLVGGCH